MALSAPGQTICRRRLSGTVQTAEPSASTNWEWYFLKGPFCRLCPHDLQCWCPRGVAAAAAPPAVPAAAAAVPAPCDEPLPPPRSGICGGNEKPSGAGGNQGSARAPAAPCTSTGVRRCCLADSASRGTALKVSLELMFSWCLSRARGRKGND